MMTLRECLRMADEAIDAMLSANERKFREDMRLAGHTEEEVEACIAIQSSEIARWRAQQLAEIRRELLADGPPAMVH